MTSAEAMFIGVVQEKDKNSMSWFDICEEESVGTNDSYEDVVMMVGNADYESTAFCFSFFDHFDESESESDEEYAPGIYEGHNESYKENEKTANAVLSIGATPRNKFVQNMKRFGDKNLTKNTEWLLDSGATLHVTNDENLLRDSIDIDRSITVGSGEVVTGIKQSWTEIRLGGDRTIRLKEVVFVPNFVKNILSVNKLCANGTTVTIRQNEAILQSTKGGQFRVRRSKNGMFYLRDTT